MIPTDSIPKNQRRVAIWFLRIDKFPFLTRDILSGMYAPEKA